MLPEQLKSRSSHLFSHCLMYKLIRLFFFSLNVQKVHRVMVLDGTSLDLVMPVGSVFVQTFIWISLSVTPLSLKLQEGFY